MKNESISIEILDLDDITPNVLANLDSWKYSSVMVHMIENIQIN